eukprot:COSAG06_NODE_4560_length_4145_cov_1.345032_1_plen_121_part_00
MRAFDGLGASPSDEPYITMDRRSIRCCTLSNSSIRQATDPLLWLRPDLLVLCWLWHVSYHQLQASLRMSARLQATLSMGCSHHLSSWWYRPSDGIVRGRACLHSQPLVLSSGHVMFHELT